MWHVKQDVYRQVVLTFCLDTNWAQMAIILVSEIIRRILPYTKFTELLLYYFYKSIENRKTDGKRRNLARVLRVVWWTLWAESRMNSLPDSAALIRGAFCHTVLPPVQIKLASELKHEANRGMKQAHTWFWYSGSVSLWYLQGSAEHSDVALRPEE